MGKKKSIGCNCIDLVNKALADVKSNTRLDIPFTLNIRTGRSTAPKVSLVVCKADPKKRERLATLLATYCPFCGKKYPKD